jgi:hypothetical protein
VADSGYPRSPVVIRGAFVQLLEDLGIIIPNIVPFQYNPAKVTRGFQPWNPFATAPQNQASQTPLVQPFDPQQTYRFDLEFDATDDLEAENPVAIATGIGSRLAALHKLIEPSAGLFGDLIASVNALAGSASRQAERPAVPITLFVLGPGAVLPVRITELSIEITEFSPLLYPMMAKATVALQVLTPDIFKCKETTATSVAIAAYNFTKLQEDALAILNVTNVATAIGSSLPL